MSEEGNKAEHAVDVLFDGYLLMLHGVHHF
jgi:hypothetical protein